MQQISVAMLSKCFKASSLVNASLLTQLIQFHQAAI